MYCIARNFRSQFSLLHRKRHFSVPLADRVSDVPKINYPKPRRDESVSDNFFGIKTIKDPYRWMEDANASETKEFANHQNKVSTEFLDRYERREYMRELLTNVWNYPKYGCLKKTGKRYFYKENSGLQNQNVLYILDSLNGTPNVLLDPNALSEDGSVSLNTQIFSRNGKYLAYGVSVKGSDWIKIRVQDVNTKHDFPEILTNIKTRFVSWSHDSTGFFYSKIQKLSDGEPKATYKAPAYKHSIYYHKLNTNQTEDILIFESPDNSKWLLVPQVSDCGKYLLVYILNNLESCQVYYTQLEDSFNDKSINFTPLTSNFEALYHYVTNEGSVFTFRTNKNRSWYALVNIDLQNPDESHWKDLIPERPGEILEWAVCTSKNKLLTCFLKDVVNVLYVHDSSSGEFLGQIPLELGTIRSYYGHKDNSDVFLQFTSYTEPGIVYHLDMSEKINSPTVVRRSKLNNYPLDCVTTEQIFYHSKDGTKVPMFVMRDKNAKLDGLSPCLLTAYGSLNHILKPIFSVFQMLLVKEFGFVCAVANIRGGGEYGKAWHIGGSLHNKQNSLNDLQCAAEYLVEKKYTSEDRLAVSGHSNGGLVALGCLNQRPDLFAAGLVFVLAIGKPVVRRRSTLTRTSARYTRGLLDCFLCLSLQGTGLQKLVTASGLMSKESRKTSTLRIKRVS